MRADRKLLKQVRRFRLSALWALLLALPGNAPEIKFIKKWRVPPLLLVFAPIQQKSNKILRGTVNFNVAMLLCSMRQPLGCWELIIFLAF